MGHTVAEDAGKEVLKKRGFCVDVVVMEDVLDCPTVADHEAVILEWFSCSKPASKLARKPDKRTLKKALNL